LGLWPNIKQVRRKLGHKSKLFNLQERRTWSTTGSFFFGTSILQRATNSSTIQAKLVSRRKRICVQVYGSHMCTCITKFTRDKTEILLCR